MGDYLADSQINSHGKERGTLALQLQAKKKLVSLNSEHLSTTGSI